jgi:hypothetical protein
MEPLLQTSLPRVSLVSAVLLLLAIWCFARLKTRAGEKARRRKGAVAWLGRVLVSLLLFVIAVVLVAVAGGIYWFGKQLQRFEIVRPSRVLVGTVECLWKDQEAHQSLVQFTPFSGETSGRAQIYRLRGDEVSVSGDILAWDRSLRVLGFRDCYQTTRLEGWARGPLGRPSFPDTVCWLGRGPHPFYLYATVYEDRLPFVETRQAQRAFLIPDEDVNYTIYVAGTTYSAVPARVKYAAPAEEEKQTSQ